MKTPIQYLTLLIALSRLVLITDGWLNPWLIHRADQKTFKTCLASANSDDSSSEGDKETNKSTPRSRYELGIGKHQPHGTQGDVTEVSSDPTENWIAPDPVAKPPKASTPPKPERKNRVKDDKKPKAPKRTRRMVARDQKSASLRSALWDEQHYGGTAEEDPFNRVQEATTEEKASTADSASGAPPYPTAFYPDIDLSIPDSVYAEDGSVDLVWDLLRWEAYEQAQREPLLVSFMHSTILNHPSLESSLAFLLANRLQSPAMMISTQLQSLVLDALRHDPVFRRNLRADMMAVRDRDPACNFLPDVFLYFKGFHALQSHRVAHCLWQNQKQVLALFLQSQVSQIFQIDIHPNATLGSGMLVDHGTGVVIGSTASVGHNCSILHHVTLGGSGKKGVDRHPKIGDGVLLGAGATILGPVRIGEGCQIGAGTLVISDIPAHSVAVGVPARIIGSFVDVTEQPSLIMNQLMDESVVTFESEGI